MKLQKIEQKRILDVPSGEFCIFMENRKFTTCKWYSSSSSKIGWDAGLGSPGTIYNDSCLAFNVNLVSVQRYDNISGYSYGSYKKCKDCLNGKRL